MCTPVWESVYGAEMCVANRSLKDPSLGRCIVHVRSDDVLCLCGPTCTRCGACLELRIARTSCHRIGGFSRLSVAWEPSASLVRVRLFSQVLAPALWPLSRFFDSNSSAGAFDNIIWVAPKEPSWLLCSGAATKDFLMGRKSFILEVWAAPGALESFPKDRWLSPYFLQGIPGLRCRPDPRNDRLPTLSKIFHTKLTRRPACVHISYTLASR